MNRRYHVFCPNRNAGEAAVSDLAKWKVHGPVKMLRTEFATWDSDRHDWQPAQHFTVASFRPDGAISSTDGHNPDGTIAHSRFLYDDAGRITESNSWMNDGPIDRTLYLYDEDRRLTRTTHLRQDGTRTDVEVFSYDADGKKTKVRFLPHRETDRECDTTNACVARTAYSIEGTDSAYGAPGATTMTVAYDQWDLPAKVSFHDADHRPLSYVILMRDSAGRLLSEELHQGDRSPFQDHLDKAPQEERERLAAVFAAVMGDVFSTTIYQYDAKGRLARREHRLGNLGGDSTTYRYGDSDDPVEEITEHRSREGSVDETGSLHYSPDRIDVQHSRLEYLYDAQGNWTERIVSFRSDSEPAFQRSNIERRMITYYST
jgi:hypothetical protein